MQSRRRNSDTIKTLSPASSTRGTRGIGPAGPAPQGLHPEPAGTKAPAGSGSLLAMGLRMMLLLVVLVPLTIGLVLVGGAVSLLLAQAVPSWLNE